MRYQVKVMAPNGALVCGATLNCTSDEAARRRLDELPLPVGDAELRRGARLIARRPVAAPPSAARTAY